MRLALAGLSVAFCLAGPTALAIALRRRFSVGWRVFLAGVGSFILSQVVHLPMLWAMGKLDLIPTVASADITPLRALALGLAAGLCEETARVVMLRPLVKARSGADAIMFGLGHGGIEAMLLGGVLLAAQVTSMTALAHTDLATVAKDAAQLDELRQKVELFSQSNPAAMLVPALERVMAMGAQLALSLLVMLSLRTGKIQYFLGSVALHTTIDGVGVFAAQRLANAMMIEGVVFVLIVPGVVWMIWELRRIGMGSPRRPSSLADEWARFRVILHKELRQPWRTRSAFLVMGVFLLTAGLAPAVPLSLKLIPEEARAKLAESGLGQLIPASSVNFALQQYVKLIGQLGFLAVAVGAALSMAAERQRGALALMCSKPVPRWGLVIAKTIAHLMVCGAAFGLGSAVAFAAIAIGYGTPAPGAFLGVVALLFVWLATFISVAMAASCMARTEGGAIGWMAVFSVVLLLLGAIPKYGAVAPSGLTGWAHELATGDLVHANGASLAMSMVVIILSLLWAIRHLEEAEF